MLAFCLKLSRKLPYGWLVTENPWEGCATPLCLLSQRGHFCSAKYPPRPRCHGPFLSSISELRVSSVPDPSASCCVFVPWFATAPAWGGLICYQALYTVLAEEVPSLLAEFYCVPTASQLAVPISQVVRQTLTKAWGPLVCNWGPKPHSASSEVSDSGSLEETDSSG